MSLLDWVLVLYLLSMSSVGVKCVWDKVRSRQ
jgi:hypothetical protein